MNDVFIRRASVVRVIDGDTFELRMDLGYRVEGRFIVRLRGVDTPELPTVEGLAARATAERILQGAKTITVQSYKDQQSFARWIADVYVDGVSLAELMKGSTSADAGTAIKG